MGSTPTTAPANIHIEHIQVERITHEQSPAQIPKQIVIEDPPAESVNKKEEDMSTQRGTIELDQRRPSEARSMKAKIKDVKKLRESDQIAVNPEVPIRKKTQNPPERSRFEQLQIVDLE